jgi:hypothetical protein
MSKITSFFAPVSKPSTTLSILPVTISTKKEEVKPVIITSEGMDTFYASLTPKQRLAHSIAAKALGTSYDVQRTHDYNNWLKK